MSSWPGLGQWGMLSCYGSYLLWGVVELCKLYVSKGQPTRGDFLQTCSMNMGKSSIVY